MNINGIIIGLGAFLIIGLLHPVVIKTEYYFGTKAWPVFLLAGLACIGGALFCTHQVFAPLLAIFGFSLFWATHELFAQKKRVAKGWFPANPRKK